jgi:hypothetical protein
MTNDQLQGYFHFDDADLAANRNGNLTEKQTQRLKQRSGISKSLRIFLGLLLFGISICLTVFTIAMIPQITNTPERIIWPFFFGFFALLTVMLGFFFLRGLFRKTNLAIEKTQGPVNIVAVQKTDNRSNHYTSHEFHIGGETFLVTSRLANILMQGDSCTVYFVRDAPGEKSVLKFSNVISVEGS